MHYQAIFHSGQLELNHTGKSGSQWTQNCPTGGARELGYLHTNYHLTLVEDSWSRGRVLISCPDLSMDRKGFNDQRISSGKEMRFW